MDFTYDHIHSLLRQARHEFEKLGWIKADTARQLRALNYDTDQLQRWWSHDR